MRPKKTKELSKVEIKFRKKQINKFLEENILLYERGNYLALVYSEKISVSKLMMTLYKLYLDKNKIYTINACKLRPMTGLSIPGFTTATKTVCPLFIKITTKILGIKTYRKYTITDLTQELFETIKKNDVTYTNNTEEEEQPIT